MTISNFTTNELKNEYWKQIPSGRGYYAASNLGRIQRIKTYKGKGVVGRIIKQQLDGDKYPRLSFSVEGKSTARHVHSLVTEAFLGKRIPRYTVNHKDGNKCNNRISNLEYLTRKDNLRHAKNTGLIKSGRLHHNRLNTLNAYGYRSKLKPKQVTAIPIYFPVLLFSGSTWKFFKPIEDTDSIIV